MKSIVFKKFLDVVLLLKPYFKNVKVFETVYSNRHNLYFWASDSVLPFDSKWDAIAVNIEGNTEKY